MSAPPRDRPRMLRRLIAPLVFGLAGAGVLVGLGVWQVQRLQWKTGILAEINARISDAPVALPQMPDPVADRYLPVQATGRITGESIVVLASRKQIGAGYRIIVAYETGGRRVMVDLGFLPEAAAGEPLAAQALRVTGNLNWPDEVDGYTPDPDTTRNIWFARDVPLMAAALKTEPVLIVARETSLQSAIEPLPVDTATIPNDHLAYAITWFLLAFVWSGMTVLLAWRITQRSG